MRRFYEQKNWPSFTEEMLASLVAWGRTAERAIPTKKEHPFSMLKAPWYLREWVSENTPIELDERWMVTLQRFNAPHSPFHIDTLRDWSYNCVIDGSEAVTHFKDDMDGEVVCSVQYPVNRWFFHNGSKPHGVTGIPGIRTAVTMFMVRPDKLRPAERVAGTAPQLAKAYKRDPYFYYVRQDL